MAIESSLKRSVSNKVKCVMHLQDNPPFDYTMAHIYDLFQNQSYFEETQNNPYFIIYEPMSNPTLPIESQF